MLETLETIEERSQLDILRDLLAIVPNFTRQDDRGFGVKGQLKSISRVIESKLTIAHAVYLPFFFF
ncbi:hypothetical protein [Laspinema olomoucense]|uniref:hypothetical protein n=1 Tax=Laspinema olomoucense TaxID=3231600 RepID=UPI0021BA8947|nr:hypothetical protein [Laspinema sp. D3c]